MRYEIFVFCFLSRVKLSCSVKLALCARKHTQNWLITARYVLCNKSLTSGNLRLRSGNTPELVGYCEIVPASFPVPFASCELRFKIHVCRLCTKIKYGNCWTFLYVTSLFPHWSVLAFCSSLFLFNFTPMHGTCITSIMILIFPVNQSNLCIEI